MTSVRIRAAAEQLRAPLRVRFRRRAEFVGPSGCRRASLPASRGISYCSFGSGAILTEVIKAQEVLESQYNVGADVWSVTSYIQLYRDGHAADR